MPIPSSGQISLNDNINATLQADTNESNVSLGDNNAVKFTAVADGDTVSGRSMSELRGQTLFQINPTTEAAGWLGDSLHMDGITSNHNSVKVLEPGSTTAPVFTNTKGTFSLWVKIHKTTSSSRYLYTSGTSDSNSLVAILLHSSGTNHKLYVRIDGVYFTSQATFIDKAGWYNFVISLDSSILMDREKIKAYANGIPLHWESWGNLTDNQAFQFGTNQRINDWAFSAGYGADATYGSFIFVDGKALLPNEFGELSYGVWVPKAVNKQSSDTLITTNLVANYQFQGNSNDTSGSSTTYNGTDSNVTYRQNNHGIVSFTGNSDNSRISLGASNQFAGTAVTFSFWYMPTAAIGSGGYDIIMNNYTTGSPNFGMYRVGSDAIELSLQTGSSGTWYRKSIPNAIPLNKWTHVTWALDGSQSAEADKVKLYIDGVEFEHFNNTGTGTTTGNILDTSLTLYLGDWDHQPGYNDNSNWGELQIYTSTLSAANVLQNYNATKHKYFYGLNGWHFNLNNTDTGSVITPGSNLKIHLDAGDWDADGTDETSFSGTTWSDKSGNSNNGTISGATYSTDNGGCFDFDGSNDKVNLGNSTLLNSGDYTAEFWMKNEGNDSDAQMIVSQRTNSDSTSPINITFYGVSSSSNAGLIYFAVGSSWFRTGTALSKDTWYHITCTVVAGGVMRVYVNGLHQSVSAGTASETGTRPTPTNQNLALGANGSDTTYPFNGKIAQFKIYNKALTAQEVIQNFRATQGHYKVLSLADISGNAKGGIANGTNLTGADHTGDKSNVNYVTLSEEDKSTSVTLSDGGHALTHTSGSWRGGVGTMGVSSGKWYYEIKITAVNTSGATANNAYFMAGWQKAEAVGDWESSPFSTYNNVIVVTGSGAFGVIANGTSPHYGTSNINGGSQFALNDVLGIALNADTGAVQIYKNGSALGSAVTLTADTYHVYYSKWSNTHDNATFNFGAKGFAHTPPSGYLALSSDNIPTANNVDPVNKKKPSDYFNTVLYTASPDNLKSITGVGFAPDFTWVKSRDFGYANILVDSVRGAGSNKMLISEYSGEEGSTNDTYANAPKYGYVSSLDPDGFTVSRGSTNGSFTGAETPNAIGNYVSWNWKAGGKPTATNAASAGAAPTSGSVMIDGVASTANLAGGVPAKKISANTSAGFSIVQYTGQSGGTQTVAHGLTKAPRMIIQKQTNGSMDWYVYFPPGVVDSNYNYLVLNSTSLSSTTSSAAPTTTTFNPVSTQDDFIAYCFHDVDGYQKIGTYSSNNSTNGPFVYLGFKPAWVLLKKVSGTAYSASDNWWIYDGTRDSENTIGKLLAPNAATAEGGIKGDDVYPITFTSNGFKVTGSGEGQNWNGDFIYYAIAADSAKYSQGFGQTEGTVEKFLEKGTGSTEYPANHFQVARYTGTGASKKINLNFKPGLTWIKNLDDTENHGIFDSVRGVNQWIHSNLTNAQTDYSGNYGVLSFDNDGFTIGNGTAVSGNTEKHIAWNWKAGDTQVTKKPTYTSSGILTSNLALHYNFADSNTYSGSGTTVYDLTSNDNDATLNNSPSWIDRENGNYFDLDGSNDSIECTTIKDDVDDGQSVSMEVWFKCSSSQSGEGIICGFAGSSGDAGMDIGIKPSTGLLYISQGDGSTGAGYDVRDNKWHHAVMTMTTSVKNLYLDGILIDSSSASNRGTFPNDFHIGTWADDAYNGYYYKGAVGQVRIYTAELNQSQIRANYNATKTLYQGVGTTGNVLQTGLLNNIDLDSFDAYDPSRFGADNKVAKFSANGTIDLPATIDDPMRTASAFAMSAWYKHETQTNSYGGKLICFLNNIYNFIQIETNGTWYARVANSDNTSTEIEGLETLTVGTWYHIVWTGNATNGCTLYCNGVKQGNGAWNGTFMTYTNSNYLFNKIGYQGSGVSYLKGSVDMVRLYNKEVTNAEVKTLFHETSATTGTLNPSSPSGFPSGCYAAYNFNSDSGSSVDDLSTNYDATASSVSFEEDSAVTGWMVKDLTSNKHDLGAFYNATINNSNKWGRSIKYDGTGDFVTLPVGLGRTATQDVTREFWVKVDDYPVGSGNKDSLFYCGDMSANQYYETISVHPDGTLEYQERAGNSSTSGISLGYNSDGPILPEGVWAHVAYTVSGGTKTIYINGQAAATKVFSDTKVNNSAYGGTLGGFRGSAAATFQGEIAQFRSYTSALTNTQIKANYDATRLQFFSPLTHSTVSVNEKAGFSIVKLTGPTGPKSTVAHGLGARPDFILAKRTDDTGNWAVQAPVLGYGYMVLNTGGTYNEADSSIWSNTIAGPTEITISSGNATFFPTGGEYVCYCWRSIPGYSKIGTYVGRGSTASKIYLGFSPRYILLKNIIDANDWTIYDRSRVANDGGDGDMDNILYANTTAANATTGGNWIKPTATGFETKNTSGSLTNESGDTFLYMAFA